MSKVLVASQPPSELRSAALEMSTLTIDAHAPFELPVTAAENLELKTTVNPQ